MNDRPHHPVQRPDPAPPAGRARAWISRLFGAGARSAGTLQSFRRLAMQLDYELGRLERGRVLMITPACSADDAAHAAVELAHILATELGKRVALIDGALGAGALSGSLRLADSPGLADILRGESVEPRYHDISLEGVSFMPRGRIGAGGSIPLGASAVRRIIDDARACFDYVLIPTDSVRDDSRCLVFPPTADRVLLLAIEGRTRLEHLDICRRAMEDCSETRVGLVLTRPWRPLSIL